MIDQILILIGINISMILFHELGHWIMIKNLKLDYSFHFFGFDFNTNDKQEARTVFYFGIIFGLMPLLIIMDQLKTIVIMLLLLAYIIPCKSDINRIRDLR